MARTIQEIQGLIITKLAENNIVVSASLTSRRRMWTWVVAFCILTLETLYDFFRSEVDEVIATKKPHTTRWYAEKSKLFQYGYDLDGENDYYDNSALTEQQIADSLIVKHSAVIEQDLPNNAYGLRIKVAKQGATDLEALTNPQLDAFSEYLARIKDAGTRLLITTGPPDSLKLSLKVYYNPLVLNSEGHRLDGSGNTSLQDAIDAHLENLPFNGRFNLTELIDAMQAVYGIEDPRIISAQTRYGALPFTEVNDERIPDAGYLRIYDDADLIIQWVPKSGV